MTELNLIFWTPLHILVTLTDLFVKLHFCQLSPNPQLLSSPQSDDRSLINCYAWQCLFLFTIVKYSSLIKQIYFILHAIRNTFYCHSILSNIFLLNALPLNSFYSKDSKCNVASLDGNHQQDVQKCRNEIWPFIPNQSYCNKTIQQC